MSGTKGIAESRDASIYRKMEASMIAEGRHQAAAAYRDIVAAIGAQDIKAHSLKIRLGIKRAKEQKAKAAQAAKGEV